MKITRIAVKHPPDWHRVSVHLGLLDRVIFAIVFGERAVDIPCIRIGGNWNSLSPIRAPVELCGDPRDLLDSRALVLLAVSKAPSPPTK
jgi:hypothetical protein